MNDASKILDAVELQSGPDPKWTVIWLHGLGADGHDFEPIVPQLVRPSWPAIRFVFPHAPMRAVTINNGMHMRAWYDIRSLDIASINLADRADEAGVEESIVQVEALVAREFERGVPRARILLAGFSQGGAIVLAMGLRSNEPFAGLIALSTYLPLAQKAEALLAPGAVLQPLFMAHGKQDPVVPCVAGEQSAALLRKFGFSVDWNQYPMPHAVCAEEIGDLADWMERRLCP